MPEMHCFTPIQLKAAMDAAGFAETEVYGFPITIAPKQRVHGAKGVADELQNSQIRATLFALECRLALNSLLAYRGKCSLIAIASKAADGLTTERWSEE
jgi:hypothetical protein